MRALLEELMPKDKAAQLGIQTASIFCFNLMNSIPHWYKMDGDLSQEEIASKVYIFISEALSIS
jgi:hypothetical protein